jgi:glutamate synthase domain-containing protein 3
MTNGTVVILGTTGRNFGAGMSGGEAFVLDLADTFLDRYNPGMIDPERVAAGSPEEVKVKGLVEEHVRETGSPLGHHILDHWAEARECFWYVKPNTTPVKKDSQALVHVPNWSARARSTRQQFTPTSPTGVPIPLTVAAGTTARGKLASGTAAFTTAAGAAPAGTRL